jgi:flagellar protein FliO/FliZ
MQFLTSLLGGSGSTILTSVLALGVVLALIVLGLWALKFFTKAGAAMRPQGRRLQVVDQVQLDAKRQLLIIRRDNVEHVLLTGGPQDVVVESGIAVPDKPAAMPVRRPQPQPAPSAETLRPSPPAEPLRPANLRPQLERLREFSRPAAPPRKPTSLRHTGLLRPVSVMEPAVIPMPPIAGDNSGRGKADSATTPSASDTNGRTTLGAQGIFGDGDNR